MENKISEIIGASVAVKRAMLEDAALIARIGVVVRASVQAFREGKKLLFCGNGGSAADAQHIAAELSGRFYLDREPLFAEALHVNTSYLTAVANDYGFEEVYARLVRAKGVKGDLLFAISTSGNSPNILRAAEEASDRGMTVVGMTGAGGGKLAALCDHLLAVPGSDTPRIQEAHILIGHIICELVEAEIFPQ